MWSGTHRVCEAISWLLEWPPTGCPMTSHLGSQAGSSQFSHMLDVLWRAKFHGAEVPHPFLPTCISLLIALTAVPPFLGTFLLQDLFIPPAPPSSSAGQFSGVRALAGLQWP